MKKILFLLLSWGLVSCYPPRIIYVLDDIYPIEKNDSIDIRLLKGSSFSTNAQTITSMLSIDICNKSNSILILNKKNRLEASIDSDTLLYELVESDTLPLLLEPKLQKNLLLIFKAEDPQYLLYNSMNNKKGHLLALNLRFQDISGKEFDKIIILKSLKTKRWLYENEK